MHEHHVRKYVSGNAERRRYVADLATLFGITIERSATGGIEHVAVNGKPLSTAVGVEIDAVGVWLDDAGAVHINGWTSELAGQTGVTEDRIAAVVAAAAADDHGDSPALGKSLTGLSRAVNALADRRSPERAWALAQQIEAFAALEPAWDPEGRVNLLAKLARTIDPRAPRDADVALATLRLAVVGDRWRHVRYEERDCAEDTHAALRVAVEAGLPEARAAVVAGVDRMTVRRALGKL